MPRGIFSAGMEADAAEPCLSSRALLVFHPLVWRKFIPSSVTSPGLVWRSLSWRSSMRQRPLAEPLRNVIYSLGPIVYLSGDK